MQFIVHTPQFYTCNPGCIESINNSSRIQHGHTTVLPVAVLSLRAGNFARPYELPESIVDVEAQRKSKTGSQVLLGMYLCGMKSAQTLVNTSLPPTTRRRYLARAQALGKRTRGKPVGGNAPKNKRKEVKEHA
jgi:hypothetical protein